MLIREELNREQIKILKNHEEIILSSELIELDLSYCKILIFTKLRKNGISVFLNTEFRKVYVRFCYLVMLCLIHGKGESRKIACFRVPLFPFPLSSFSVI